MGRSFMGPGAPEVSLHLIEPTEGEFLRVCWHSSHGLPAEPQTPQGPPKQR